MTAPNVTAGEEVEGVEVPATVPAVAFTSAPSPAVPPFPTLRDVADAHFREALRRAGGRKDVAAAMLGVVSKTVYNWIARTGWEWDELVGRERG